MLVILIDKNGKRCELNMTSADTLGVIYTMGNFTPTRAFRYSGAQGGLPVFVEVEHKEVASTRLNFR